MATKHVKRVHTITLEIEEYEFDEEQQLRREYRSYTTRIQVDPNMKDVTLNLKD